MSLPDSFLDREKEVVALSVRLNWRGRPVLQCARGIYRLRLLAEGKATHEWRRPGAFRDVRKADALEVAIFLESHCSFQPKDSA